MSDVPTMARPSDDWVIERIFSKAVHDIQKERPWEHLPWPNDGILCRAFGRMFDGRQFYWEIVFSREFWNYKGQECCEAEVRRMARPPEEMA